MDLEFYVTKPLEGQPLEFENDLQKSVYQNLQASNIEFLRVENEPAITMEDCKNIDKAFGVETVKTVFLTNRQKTKFYILSMPAEKPFITKDFGAALQIPRVSFADGELLESILGTPHGAATPLSVVKDDNNQVLVVLDKEIVERDQIVCTDGTLHGFVCLSPKDLIEKYLLNTHHVPAIISL